MRDPQAQIQTSFVYEVYEEVKKIDKIIKGKGSEKALDLN